MAMTSLPMIGEEWAGYRLRGVIGRGGMSTVYEAENPRLGSLVALKVLAPELAEDDVFRARFLKESRIAASLNHPNVIPINDMGSCDGLLYIAMRYVAGPDLRSILKVRHRLPADEALTLLGQTARALDAAHRLELVHRDVKPGNILVESGGDEDDPDHVYLSDFGITKHARSRSGLTATGEFMGTIDYLAPEQIQGRPVDGRADQYSLACVLYQCVTGRVPFLKDIDAAIIWAHVEEWPALPSEVRPELPGDLDGVIMGAMAKQPEDRYQSCREFVAAARGALAGPAGVQPADASLPEPAGAHPAAAFLTAPVGAQPAASSLTSLDPALSGEGGPGAASPAQRAAGPPAHSGAAPPARRGAAPPSPAGPAGPHRWYRRSRWLAALGVIVVLIGVGATWMTLRGQSPATSAASSMPATTAHPKAGKLTHALIQANQATRNMLPMSTCKMQSNSLIMCMKPALGVTSVTFHTYPSLAALYNAYIVAVRGLGNKLGTSSIRTNFGDCSRRISFGEVSWNHDTLHLKNFSIDQSRSGMLNPGSQAAGRVFCTFSGSGSEFNIVWTEDSGNLLGQMSGEPHKVTLDWWRKFHHAIAFGGPPMHM